MSNHLALCTARGLSGFIGETGQLPRRGRAGAFRTRTARPARVWESTHRRRTLQITLGGVLSPSIIVQRCHQLRAQGAGLAVPVCLCCQANARARQMAARQTRLDKHCSQQSCGCRRSSNTSTRARHSREAAPAACTATCEVIMQSGKRLDSRPPDCRTSNNTCCLPPCHLQCVAAQACLKANTFGHGC